MSTNQNSNNMGGVTVNNNISNTPQININNTPGWVKIVSTVAVLLVSILAGAYWYFTITITATNKLDAPPSVPGTPVSQEVPSPPPSPAPEPLAEAAPKPAAEQPVTQKMQEVEASKGGKVEIVQHFDKGQSTPLVQEMKVKAIGPGTTVTIKQEPHQ